MPITLVQEATSFSNMPGVAMEILPMYGSLTSAVNESFPVAKAISDSVLCLPSFPNLDEAEQQRVVNIIRGGV